MMALLCVVCTAILALLGWIGKSLVTTLKEIKETINRIEVTIASLSTSHETFKKDIGDRVTKLENKVFN